MSQEVADPVSGLLPSQIEGAQRIWKVVRPNQKFHGVHFYQRLMTKYPEYQALFSFFKDRQMDQLIRDRDPRLIRQALRIMMAIDAVFMSLDKPEKVVDMCYQLGYRHHAYGLNANHFLTSRPVLLSSLATDLGTSVVDDESANCISAVFDFFIPHALRGLADAAAGRPMANKSADGHLVHGLDLETHD